MVNKTLLVWAMALLTLSACKHKINAGKLYGNWTYIKIDKPKSDDPTDTVSTNELIERSPYISFTKKNQLIIYWDGKILSHGTYVISDDNINYTEQLADGTTRTFPFYVSKLDGKTIVFETMGKDGSRVTAIKNGR
jgi:hypothetical protein